MKKINKFFQTVFCFLILSIVHAESKILSTGSSDAKIVVKVFSSLTCPHCANFHTAVFSNLKRDYIDKGLVKFEHHAFPLDLAALNAEVIVRCQTDNEKKFQLLGEIYKKQKLSEHRASMFVPGLGGMPISAMSCKIPRIIRKIRKMQPLASIKKLHHKLAKFVSLFQLELQILQN